MLDSLGVNFAPTSENSLDADRNAQVDGLPQAIKILSLRLPRFVGARGLAPDALMQAQGANGMDPYLSAVMQTLMQTVAPQAAQGMGGGFGEFGGFGGGTGGVGGGTGSPPPPVIIPGVEAPDPGLGFGHDARPFQSGMREPYTPRGPVGPGRKQFGF